MIVEHGLSVSRISALIMRRNAARLRPTGLSQKNKVRPEFSVGLGQPAKFRHCVGSCVYFLTLDPGWEHDVDSPPKEPLSEPALLHKLAAILYADVEGYSRLTGADESGTHRTLSAYLDLFADTIKAHRGEVKHYAGDAVLADFTTVSDALNCAVAFQKASKEKNEAVPEAKRVKFRIGLNLGEVIVDRGEVYGNGVNVAARLETLAEPGGICASGQWSMRSGRSYHSSTTFSVSSRSRTLRSRCGRIGLTSRANPLPSTR